MILEQSEILLEQPLVTIGVASYNNAKFVIETLDSIANQTYKNIELLINDDASTDNSVDLIAEWLKTHQEIKAMFLISKTNQGICKACNRILQNATGKYICLIGSDDRYLPEFISKRVRLLEERDSSVGLCYSMTYFIDVEGHRVGEDIRAQNPSGFIFDHITSGFGSFCKPFTNMIRRECFKSVGYYDESLIYEDWDWYLRVSKVYQILFHESIDTEYRLVPGSLGSQVYSKNGIESQFKIINKHLGHSINADLNFTNRLKGLAIKSYELNTNISDKIFQKALEHTGSVKFRLIYLAYRLSIPWSIIKLFKK